MYKLITFSVVNILMSGFLVGSSESQEQTMPAFLEDAIIVDSFNDIGKIALSSGQRLTFRLKQCNREDLCYVTIYARTEQLSTSAIVPEGALASSAIL